MKTNDAYLNERKNKNVSNSIYFQRDATRRIRNLGFQAGNRMLHAFKEIIIRSVYL